MSTLETAPTGKATVSLDAPWTWLAKGWKDLTSAPLYSLSVGLTVVIVGSGILWFLWQTGNSSLIPIAFSAFVLVGPIYAVSLYEISRRLENGDRISFGRLIFVQTKSPLHIYLMGVFLLLALLVWVRIATLLYALFILGDYQPLSEFVSFAFTTPSGLSMLALGTVIGAFIAFAIYSATVISIPMLMNEDSDAFSAIITSINVVKENFWPMLLWAWLIVVVTAIGIGAAFIGLAIAFPLLGHATWHAYKDIRANP